MAKSNINTGLDDISGKLSKWVYRNINGKTVVAARPKFKKVPPTEGQQQVRLSFRLATSYARTTMANPVLRPIYEAVAKTKRVPVFALAVGDYYKPPIVDLIDLGKYTGKVGDKIRVLATDDVQVASMQVAIRLLNGTVVEQGAAVEQNREWFYTATTALAPNATVKIEAIAKDHPDHEGRLEKAYP